MMNKINLEVALKNSNFSEFSKKYLSYKNTLEETNNELINLEEEINNKEDLKTLFQEYLDTKRSNLLLFVAKHPVFSAYLRDKLKYDEYQKKLDNCLDSFDLDKIGKNDCKHVFAIMHGNYVCINCALCDRDLLIRDEEELETFKDIVNKKDRFAGNIIGEELAYLDLIYSQHLKNNEIKILKKTK